MKSYEQNLADALDAGFDIEMAHEVATLQFIQDEWDRQDGSFNDKELDEYCMYAFSDDDYAVEDELLPE